MSFYEQYFLSNNNAYQADLSLRTRFITFIYATFCIMDTMKKLISITLLSIGLLVSTILYIYYETRVFAPARLDIQRVRLEDKQVPESFDGIRILYFSDLHIFAIDPIFSEQVFSTIQLLKPDLILFGGDLIDASKQTLNLNDEALLIQWLSSIEAPLGKFAILGDDDLNHDEQLNNIYTLSNFELLQTQARRIYQYDESFIELNNTDSFKTIPLVNPANAQIFSILLSYNPEVLNQNNTQSYNLVLAAKTHGGQLVLPLYGPLYAPARQNHYRGLSLKSKPAYIISNGIATIEPAYRWFTNPSLYVIELKKQP